MATVVMKPTDKSASFWTAEFIVNKILESPTSEEKPFNIAISVDLNHEKMYVELVALILESGCSLRYVNLFIMNSEIEQFMDPITDPRNIIENYIIEPLLSCDYPDLYLPNIYYIFQGDDFTLDIEFNKYILICGGIHITLTGELGIDLEPADFRSPEKPCVSIEKEEEPSSAITMESEEDLFALMMGTMKSESRKAASNASSMIFDDIQDLKIGFLDSNTNSEIESPSSNTTEQESTESAEVANLPHSDQSNESNSVSTGSEDSDKVGEGDNSMDATPEEAELQETRETSENSESNDGIGDNDNSGGDGDLSEHTDSRELDSGTGEGEINVQSDSASGTNESQSSGEDYKSTATSSGDSSVEKAVVSIGNVGHLVKQSFLPENFENFYRNLDDVPASSQNLGENEYGEARQRDDVRIPANVELWEEVRRRNIGGDGGQVEPNVEGQIEPNGEGNDDTEYSFVESYEASIGLDELESVIEAYEQASHDAVDLEQYPLEYQKTKLQNILRESKHVIGLLTGEHCSGKVSKILQGDHNEFHLLTSLHDHNSFFVVVDFAACMQLKVKNFKTFWRQSFKNVAYERKIDDFNAVATDFFDFS